VQQVQISDETAGQLHELAEYRHISASELIEQLVMSYKAEIAKREELKVFFKPYQKNMNGYIFNREEANER
jgi:predicted transcriptional regulator